MQAYRFALDPTPSQVRDLSRHCGAARVAFNWGLARVKANLGQREAERSYGIDGDGLTPAVGWSAYALRKDWNQAKNDVAPWWAQCSKEAYAAGLAQLATALKNWSDSRQGKRAGRPIGFPRFKTKRCTIPSTKFTTGTIRLESDRTHVTLPRLGTVKTHESTRKLQRRIANGTARILSATVRLESGRWFVAFTVEIQRAAKRPMRPDAVVGVDLGIKTLAVFSDDRPPVANPKHLKAASKKLRRTSRSVSRKQAPDWRTGQKASNRWLRANEQRNRVHHRVKHLRAGRDSQADHWAGPRVWHDRRRRPQRRRDGQEPQTGQGDIRRWVRGDPAPAHLQNRVARRPTPGREPLVPIIEDVLRLRRSESQTAPVRTRVRLRSLRPRPRPGRERRDQPGFPREAHGRREWPGDVKRTRSRP
jgi:transposase